MNILIANDDGIDARGIHELAEALSEVADIYICAPDSQRSASGHGNYRIKAYCRRGDEI